MKRFWSFDGEMFDRHETEKEARMAAEMALENFREDAEADGEWCEEVNGICWGEVRETAVEHQIARDEESGDETAVDYHLEPSR